MKIFNTLMLNSQLLNQKSRIFCQDEFYPLEVEPANNLFHVFVQSYIKSPNSNFLGDIQEDSKTGLKSIEFYSRKEIFKKVIHISKMLNEKCDNPDLIDNQLIGIMMPNCSNWIVSKYSIFLSNKILCPISPKLNSDELTSALELTSLKIIFISDINALKKLIGCISIKGLNSLKTIFYFGDEIKDNDETLMNLNNLNIEIIYLTKNCYTDIDDKSILEKTHSCKLNLSNIAAVYFTSGSSGSSKGVMLTHKNLTCFLKPLTEDDNPFIDLEKNPIHYSYLPLSHVFELNIFNILNCKCGTAVFWGDEPKKIQEEIKMVRPTFLVGTPYVWEKIKSTILDRLNESYDITKTLFNMALRTKIWFQKYGIYQNYFLDPIFFTPIASKFGGRIKQALTGAALIDSDLFEFIQAVFSIKLVEGYGATETAGICTLKKKDCHVIGTVGSVLPFCSVDLLTDNNIDRSYGQELYIRGDNVFAGYYTKPDDLKEINYESETFRTKDLGKEENGLIYILGRQGNTFKSSKGEFVRSEIVELNFNAHPNFYDDISIFQNDETKNVCAVIVDKKSSDSDQKIREKVLKIGKELVTQQKIYNYEIPEKIIISRDTFEDMGFLSPTNKRQTTKIKQYFCS